MASPEEPKHWTERYGDWATKPPRAVARCIAILIGIAAHTIVLAPVLLFTGFRPKPNVPGAYFVIFSLGALPGLFFAAVASFFTPRLAVQRRAALAGGLLLGFWIGLGILLAPRE